MYKTINCDLDDIQRLLFCAETLSFIRREEANHANDDDKYLILDAAAEIERAAESISRSIQYADNKLTQSEIEAELDELLQEIRKETGYTYAVHSKAAELRDYFEKLRDQKKGVMNSFALFLASFQQNLAGLQFVTRATLNADTHRQKNERIRIVLETIDALRLTLTDIDPDDFTSYVYRGEHDGSWDYRALQREVMHLRCKIGELEKISETNRDGEQ